MEDTLSLNLRGSNVHTLAYITWEEEDALTEKTYKVSGVEESIAIKLYISNLNKIVRSQTPHSEESQYLSSYQYQKITQENSTNTPQIVLMFGMRKNLKKARFP